MRLLILPKAVAGLDGDRAIRGEYETRSELEESSAFLSNSRAVCEERLSGGAADGELGSLQRGVLALRFRAR